MLFLDKGSIDRWPNFEAKTQVFAAQSLCRTREEPKVLPKHAIQTTYFMGLCSQNYWDICSGWFANSRAPITKTGLRARVTISRVYFNPKLYENIIAITQGYGNSLVSDWQDRDSSEAWKLLNLRPLPKTKLLDHFNVTYAPLADIKWRNTSLDPKYFDSTISHTITLEKLKSV